MPPHSNMNPNEIKSPPQTRTPPRSAMSPIASAKRPKKRNPASTTPMTKVPSVEANVARTPKASHAIRNNIQSLPTLSPMHDFRRVPVDSHLGVTSTASACENDGAKPDDCPADALETKLSIETELQTDLTGEFEEEGSPDSTSWVGRKVDAIFSPVLSFLQGAANANDAGSCDDEAEGVADSIQSQCNDHTSEKNGNGEGVSTMTTCNSRRDEDGGICSKPSHISESSKNLSENYDGIPNMTNTESLGSNAVGYDGDATMTDYYKIEDSDEARENHDHDMHSPVKSCEHDETVQTISAATNLNVHDEGYDYDDDDDDEEEFNPYLFIKCLPPYQHAIPPGWSTRPKVLPPLEYSALRTTPPICLVLDLDETLVHCTVEPVADADMVFPVEFNGIEYQVHVRCRPFLQEFLEAVSSKFEVVIFTASQQVYADKLLDKIDPEGKLIRYRIFRDSCLPVEGNFLKDLSILGRDLTHAVLVDNSPHAFGYQVDNGIPIESWFDDPHDRELLKLEMFLRTLHGVDDVRDVVRKAFQVHQLVLGA